MEPFERFLDYSKFSAKFMTGGTPGQRTESHPVWLQAGGTALPLLKALEAQASSLRECLGSPHCSLIRDTGISGAITAVSERVATIADCCAACKATASCQRFTFNTTEQRHPLGQIKNDAPGSLQPLSSHRRWWR